MDSLTEHDIALLSMERQWWQTAGAKEVAIRDELGMTPIHYYRRLNKLLDTEAALAHDPVMVHRLRRIRVRRRSFISTT